MDPVLKTRTKVVCSREEREFHVEVCVALLRSDAHTRRRCRTTKIPCRSRVSSRSGFYLPLRVLGEPRPVHRSYPPEANLPRYRPQFP